MRFVSLFYLKNKPVWARRIPRLRVFFHIGEKLYGIDGSKCQNCSSVLNKCWTLIKPRENWLPISLQRKKEKQLKFLKTSMKWTTMHPNRFCVGNTPYYKHPFCISSREKPVQARFSYFGFSLHNSRCYQNVVLPTHRAFGYKGRRHCRSKFDNCRKKIWKTSIKGTVGSL